MVLVQVIAIGPRYLWKYVRSAYYPLDSDIVREMQILRQQGKASALDLEGGNSDGGIVPFSTSQGGAALATREHLPLVADPYDASRQRQFSHDEPFDDPLTPRGDPSLTSWPPASPGAPPHSPGPIPSPYGPSSFASSPTYATARSTPGAQSQSATPVPHILVNDATPRESVVSRYGSSSHQSHGANDSLEFDVLDYANHRDSQWGGAQGVPPPPAPPAGFTEQDLHARSPLEAAHRQWRSEASSTGADSFHSAVQSQTSPRSTPLPQSPPAPGHHAQPSYSSGTGYAM